MRKRIIGTLTFAGAAITVAAFPYKELTPKFDRTKSLTMVRVVHSATLANLDYAAYIANPVRCDPKKQNPKAPPNKAGLSDLTFDGILTSVCNSIGETPLTDAEKDAPLAWRPLIDKLWKTIKHPGFVEISGTVEGKKWADPNVTKPYQEIVAAYVHSAGELPEMWVRVEFSPWVGFLQDVTDEDKDGYPEIYGKLVLDKIDAGLLAKAFEYIAGDYTIRVLTKDEVTDWITTLASYWYPTFNTDIIDMGEQTVWPNKETERKNAKAMKKVTVQNPTAVIRGNPFGTKIYNLYIVEGMGGGEQPAQEAAAPATVIADKTIDASVSKNFQANYDRFKEELKPHGTYEAWAKKVAPFIQSQKDFLAGLPAGQNGFRGKDDWLFFRKSLDYTTGGDLSKQAQDKNPLPHLIELKKYLNERNVNLLFVVVPNKEEVYYEKLPFTAPTDKSFVLNPYSRKFLKDAQDAGIEVIDLLPPVLQAKAEDDKHKENVYQHQDTHWSNRGLQIAARLIADRVKEYAWYPDAAKSAVAYTVRDTTFSRQGDIVERLPETERALFPAVELQASRVYLPEGQPYPQTGGKSAPIMLIGDSFTGVFESVDCKSAGVGATIAAKTGLPVDIITSWGGGPLVRDKAVRARKNDFGAKRLVVYLMVARDLYNYDQGWTPLKAE